MSETGTVISGDLAGEEAQQDHAEHIAEELARYAGERFTIFVKPADIPEVGDERPPAPDPTKIEDIPIHSSVFNVVNTKEGLKVQVFYKTKHLREISPGQISSVVPDVANS